MELSCKASRNGRLSSFLKDELNMSAGLINRLKWQDKLYVNGIPRHADYPVCAGDVICVPLDEPKPDYPAQNGVLQILYEDRHILALEKPAGMLMHPSRACNTGTLANFVAGYYERSGRSAAFHPVTRLDRDTFGVVLVAKNSHSHAKLQALQNAGKVEKVYHAWVFGGPEAEEGVIDAPIARRPLPSLLRYVNQDGKPSRTQYRVFRREKGCTLLALWPHTGRTHQLRVHCAHMGFPIVGDPQYGSEASRLGYSHQLLWAKRISFPHPITGELLQITSPTEVEL